jgi:DNA-binding transcriptional ArsR family regulator
MSSGGTLFSAPSGTRMVPSSSELIDAVNHPTRRRILRAFVEEPRRSVSARRLAEALDEPVAQVGYHLKTLARYDVLRLSQDGYGWSPGVESNWLGVVLEIWPESDGGTARAGGSAAARRRPRRGRSAG